MTANLARDERVRSKGHLSKKVFWQATFPIIAVFFLAQLRP
jgi:hypothetical protein